MPARKIATGIRSGRLTSIDDGKPKVLCQCDCGTVKLISRNHFLVGNIVSCGCLRDEKLSKMSSTHGMSDTRLYSIWCNIKSRCSNPNVGCYANYGGKGVTLCEEWQTFEGFLNSIPEGYSDDLELDRKDNSEGYYLENCRWVNRSVQCFNKETEYGGVTYCVRDNLWRAKISKAGVDYQKYFKSQDTAKDWRLEKEQELYGEYLN